MTDVIEIRDGFFESFPEEAKVMSCPMKDREFECSLGDLVEALYDEVILLPLSDLAKASLVAIMLGDIICREGRAVFFQARPQRKIQSDAA